MRSKGRFVKVTILRPVQERKAPTSDSGESLKSGPTGKKPACPKCGSNETRPIVYGLPTNWSRREAELGLVVLGGCKVWESRPLWDCSKCGNRWGRAKGGDFIVWLIVLSATLPIQ